MKYTRDEAQHTLRMDKDELLTLILLVHEGVENLKAKARDGSLVEVKLAAAEYFISELNSQIMAG